MAEKSTAQKTEPVLGKDVVAPQSRRDERIDVKIHDLAVERELGGVARDAEPLDEPIDPLGARRIGRRLRVHLDIIQRASRPALASAVAGW